jgi:putative transposase
LVDSIIPEGKPGGRPRNIDVRAVVKAIFYLLRTGCQWRLLPREFPPWPTVYYHFRRWEQESVWLTLLLVVPFYAPKSWSPCDSFGCYHGWAVGQDYYRKRGVRGFDAHKRIRGRKRHILVDTLGIPIANRVEAANMSDRRAAAGLLGGLGPIFSTIKTVNADAGHQSRKLTRLIKAEGCELRIVKRRKRTFEVVGLTWIVERTFAWIGRYCRMSKDYEHRVQTSETLIDLIAIRLMLNRLTKS